MIEIRPDFIRNNDEKIYSNMRSVICVDIQDTLTFSSNKIEKNIMGKVSIDYFFLKHDDCQVLINPIILPKR